MKDNWKTVKDESFDFHPVIQERESDSESRVRVCVGGGVDVGEGLIAR